MIRNMNWFVKGVIVTGVTAALLLCVQGCKENKPVETQNQNQPAPAPAPAAAQQATPAPAATAPKPAEPNKPADANKVSVKQAAGAVLTEAAKGAAAGAATAAGNLIGGATEKK